MGDKFHAFDFHRMFLGDTPLSFLLEIVFRTLVMYAYTIFLLRVLGKRGMGQLSTLELAIIISFGSAVGDPMVGADVPMLHGMIAITCVTLFQIYLEKLINRNKNVEAIMEGKARLIVDDGAIQLDCLRIDNLSKEDLFRGLRSKDVEHLGEINKAYFETSGQISVLFHPPRKVKPGLSTQPELDMAKVYISGTKVPDQDAYSCMHCGCTRSLQEGQELPDCPVCGEKKWVRATS